MNWFRKPKENHEQPKEPAEPPKEETPDLTQINLQKANAVADALRLLRGRLPSVMSRCDAERIRIVDGQLLKLEESLLRPLMATVDLGNLDTLAIQAVDGLEVLLQTDETTGQAEDALKLLKSALVEEWFRNDPKQIRKAKQQIAYVDALERLVRMNRDLARLEKEIRDGTQQLQAKVAEVKASGQQPALNADIMLLKNTIERKQQQLTVGRTQRAEIEGNGNMLRDALASSSLSSVSPEMQDIIDETVEEMTKRLQESIQHMKEFNEKLIRDGVALEEMRAQLESSQIYLTPETFAEIDVLVNGPEPEEAAPEAVPEAAGTVPDPTAGDPSQWNLDSIIG